MTVLRLPGEAAAGLRRYRVAVAGLACFSIWMCSIPFLLKLALTIAVMVDGIAAMGLARRRRVESLYFADSSGWVLERQGRAPVPIRIEKSSFVSRWVVILHFHDGRRSQAWCVARDRIDPETHRQLRVLLRSGRSAETALPRNETASPTPS